jgi:hypothetical protein
LKYADHPVLPDTWIAKYMGYSCVFSHYFDGVEVMDLGGEVHRFNDFFQARSFIRERTQGIP